ncbi:hypothetical protein [Cetobacterium sp.]|uniref:hypothetical protein n=1 Tax=Cetobacterium sp. TaxID=2071632 RepID=UPI002FC61A5F
MINKKLISISSLAIISMSLYGCTNNTNSNNSSNTNSNTKVINSQNINKSNSTKNIDKTSSVEKVLFNKYWVTDQSLLQSDENSKIISIFKINKDTLKFYTDDKYTEYKIKEFKVNPSKNEVILRLDLGNEYDGPFFIKIESDNKVLFNFLHYGTDVDGSEEYKVMTEKETIDLLYKEYGILGDDKQLQKLLGKTEQDLYNISKKYPEDDLTDSDISYINSKVTMMDIPDYLTDAGLLKDGNIIYDFDISQSKFNDKLGYVARIKNKQEYIDSISKCVFLDIDSGNIYEFNTASETVDFNNKLGHVKLNEHNDNNVKKTNNLSPDTKYSEEDTKKVAIQSLEKYQAYDSSNPDYKISLASQGEYNGQKYNYYSIVLENTMYDFTIGVNCSNLEPLIFYSNGEVKTIDSLQE